MKTNYQSRYAVSPKETKTMDTEVLRKNFLIENLFEENSINWIYSHYDRFITGGVSPVNQSVQLETIDPLKSVFFLERRELGIINVGGKGEVVVNGEHFTLDYKEALYIGMGNESVSFLSIDANRPAKFYLNSTPAHHSYPVKKISKSEAERATLGSLETSNHRVINKMLVSSTVKTCQLQMGMTELKVGSVWNTMPAHTHDRRMEVYFYFEVPEGQSVCHFMGEPQETRHIWMKNEEAVISPPWSIHSGAATSNYTFIWGMAGENMDYGDMDKCSISELK